MSKSTTVTHNGLICHIVLKNANEAEVDFEVFVQVGEDDDGAPLYLRKGAASGIDRTPDTTEAQRFLSGSVKWDGCSHVNFMPDYDGYEHFCGRSSAVAVGHVLGSVYDEAIGMMEVHDVDMYNGV